ncbi:Ferredoxin-type protein NapF (periplasmic nitrate reductase) [Caenispirillum salinarum AK4]|uniref:Ferredoxin-type protein NapF n=1 Tax=Caenispirillum salinarum AK4 TaxID=1238182 RepID=K9HG80_9PROT|nr:ferredoxin-type protein NapF [Caenispirillum salinarum]EKV29473.1 Ferredoxin-type protein NapF (periplasmic nitrate reductase) [Caenispirillum salinarum AK4]
MSGSPSLGRRRLLGLRKPDTPPPLRPPWAREDDIADRCTRCGDCLTACPEGILKVGTGGFPEVDFRNGSGECTFCGDCATACSKGVFAAPDPDSAATPPFAALVSIGASCLAEAGVMCQSCGDACPERAIRFALVRGGAPRPSLDLDACTACGACVSVCPADAIAIHPLEGAPA